MVAYEDELTDEPGNDESTVDGEVNEWLAKLVFAGYFLGFVISLVLR